MSWREYQITELLSGDKEAITSAINLPFDVLHEGQKLQCNPRLPAEVVFKDSEGNAYKAEIINNQKVVS